MPTVGPAPSGAENATATSFWTAVLVDMGAPVTQSNIEALSAWSQREGGGGAWNPLNTTRPEPGSSDLQGNSAHVQNYTSASQGAQATADSLNNGLYPSIVAAFKTGSAFDALVSGGKGPIGQQLRKWSGGAYNNVNSTSAGYISPTLGGGSGSASKGGASTSSAAAQTSSGQPGTCLTLGESITNASNVPLVGGLPGEAQIAGLFGWITQGCVQKRILIQGVSALLILYGFKMLGRGDPIKIITAPIKAVGKVGEAGAAMA